MNNFFEFIKKDVEAKKTLISTLPTKTKTNKKKFNLELEKIRKKYTEYEKSVKNYLIAKSDKIEIKDKKGDIEKLNSKIAELEEVKKILNPNNTYIEKMGFDTLIYQISNFYTFNFDSLNDIINGFLDKFDLAGILLNADDFDYTCYVHEYMSAFLDVKYHRTNSYEKVSEIFEQIYWVNPELINHIELNFRKLIKKNDKKFNDYLSNLQKDIMNKNGINNYAACLEKLQGVYIDLSIENRETIADIIELAKKGEINIDQYFEDNKVRINAFDSLIPSNVDYTDNKTMKKICFSLEKLRSNILEFNNYLSFEPLFIDFKEKYQDLLPNINKKADYKGLKNIEIEIDKKESELDKLNKKIFGGKIGLFDLKNDGELRKLKAESVTKAKELYELYKTYDDEYFKDKVIEIVGTTLTVSDILNLYSSFDNFKKLAIQRVYKLKDYNTILEYSKNFDDFALNPANVIVYGIPIFGDVNVPRIIANKYRLNNIKMSEEDLAPEKLKSLENKILLILRVDKINSSNINIEDIWFIKETEKIISKQ